MRTPSPLPAPFHDTPFSTSAALASGVTRRRLRAHDLAVPHHGVRSRAAPQDALGRARALLPAMRDEQCFSHATAAALLGMRIPLRLATGPMHVTSIGSRAMRRPGVIGHRAGERRVVEVAGLPVTDPVETWLDLVPLLSHHDLVVSGDGLLARHDPVATIEGIGAAVDAARGRRGVRAAATALPWLRPRTDSARETELRLLVLAAGLPEPRVNEPILGAGGRVIAHGDLAWPREHVILEYEGDHHRTDRWQFSVDIDRIGRIEALGWRVIRVDNALFLRRHILIPRIRAALARGG